MQEISELSLCANHQKAVSGLLYSSSVLDQEFFFFGVASWRTRSTGLKQAMDMDRNCPAEGGSSMFSGPHDDSFIKFLGIRILSYFYLVVSAVAVERGPVSLASTASACCPS